MIRLGTLASRTGLSINPQIATLEVGALALSGTAGETDLALDVTSKQRSDPLIHSDARALLSERPSDDPRLIQVDNIKLSCARLSAWLPARRAHLASSGGIAANAEIASGASIGEHVKIGEHTRIAHGAIIGDHVSIGAYSSIGPYSVIAGASKLGNRVVVGSGCSIGEDGFAFIQDGEQWLRMPCFGAVVLGDDCTLLSHVVIHAGVFGHTRIGPGCALDSKVLIGHDSSVGKGTIIAADTAVAGAVKIGRGCRIGGKVGINEGVEIADLVTVTGMSMVAKSLTETGGRYASGWPAERATRWWRRVGNLRRIRNQQCAANKRV